MTERNAYLLLNPPGNGNVNLNGAKTRAKNDSSSPRDRAHVRLSLNKKMAIVQGTYSSEDLQWLLDQGWAIQYDHAGILAYLAANRAAWETDT